MKNTPNSGLSDPFQLTTRSALSQESHTFWKQYCVQISVWLDDASTDVTIETNSKQINQEDL